MQIQESLHLVEHICTVDDLLLLMTIRVLYVIYGSRCGGRVADKAQGEAECFITQQDPHTECHKSRKALLAHFK